MGHHLDRGIKEGRLLGGGDVSERLRVTLEWWLDSHGVFAPG